MEKFLLQYLGQNRLPIQLFNINPSVMEPLIMHYPVVILV